MTVYYLWPVWGIRATCGVMILPYSGMAWPEIYVSSHETNLPHTNVNVYLSLPPSSLVLPCYVGASFARFLPWYLDAVCRNRVLPLQPIYFKNLKAQKDGVPSQHPTQHINEFHESLSSFIMWLIFITLDSLFICNCLQTVIEQVADCIGHSPGPHVLALWCKPTDLSKGHQSK